MKHIQKIEKYNRFFDFRKLPFCWGPVDFGGEIQEDETMGIPSSEKEYMELRAKGRYRGTEIEFIFFEEDDSKADDAKFSICHENLLSIPLRIGGIHHT